MLAMRRTMFVVPVEEAPVLHAAAALAVAREQRRQNLDLLVMLGIDDPEAWLSGAEARALEALSRHGEATAQVLAREIPALREKVRMNVGKAYEGDIGMSGRVLLQLATEGRVVRGRPRGTWRSSQYRWAAMERWIGRPLPDLPVAEARTRLIGDWLARFGPGTEADIHWWTGLALRDVRSALASVRPVEIELDGQTGLMLPDDLADTEAQSPWVALLPALDATTMGWQSRDWYLGEHRLVLFDGNGNAGPTVWVDGRIVGGWAVREGGEVCWRLLEDVGREATESIEAEAARLTAWLGGTRVVPRFPRPLLTDLIGRG